VLLVLQALVIKNPDGQPALCGYCVTVDTAAILAAVAAALLIGPKGDRFSGRDDAQPFNMLGTPRISAVWVVAAVAAVSVPFVWSEYPSYPSLPAKMAGPEDPGKIPIVGFTDFECPFCRRLHPILSELKNQHEGRLTLSRRMVPLASHPGAVPAARLYLCTPKDKLDAVAHALYEANEEELTREGTIAIGKRLGLDEAALSSCVDAPSTMRQIEDDKALFAELGGLGLPLTYVGRRPVAGFQEAKLRQAVAIELGGARMSLPLWSMFAVLGAMFAGAAVATWRLAEPEQGSAAPA
jgi:thiol-disulfide isomerase/thioredoxin